MTVLDLSDDELLAIVEQDAAAGDPRAGKLLRILLEAIEREGRLTVIEKLACTPHVDGRRHQATEQSLVAAALQAPDDDCPLVGLTHHCR